MFFCEEMKQKYKGCLRNVQQGEKFRDSWLQKNRLLNFDFYNCAFSQKKEIKIYLKNVF